MRRLVLVLALAALVVPARAQQGSGLSFLRLGVNAEALALGDAHVAHSRDAWSTYWNPAGLAAAEVNTVGLSHHLWFADARTYALAGRFGVGEHGAAGLFVTATSTGGIEARLGPGDPDGLFTAGFVSAGVAYGRALGPLRVGLTAKYLSEQIYTDSANGYAIDLGAQADLFRGFLRLGAAVQNLGEMSELATTSTRLPRTVRVGVAVYPLRVFTERDAAPLVGTSLTAEVAHVFADDPRGTIEDITRLHLGLAVEVLELVTVRTGYVTNDALRGLTLGGGLGYEAFVIDYAFLPFDDSDPGHILTLSYAW